MPHLTIVAHITAAPDAIELVKHGLLGLIAPTRAEAGCVQYDLHQDNENPAYFMFFENWESRELWLAHMESDHIKAFQAATDGKIDDFRISEMTRVG